MLFLDTSCTLHVLSKLAHEYGDIYQLWLGLNRTIVTSHPADITQILRSDSNFERPKALRNMFDTAAPGSLFTMHSHAHSSARQKIRDSFNHSMLRDFHNPMLDAVNEVVDILSSHIAVSSPGTPSDIIDINAILSTVTNRIILNVAFGAHMDYDFRKRIGQVSYLYMDEMLAEVLGYPFRQILTPLGIRKGYFRHKHCMDQAALTLVENRRKETIEQRAQRKMDLLDTLFTLDNHDSSRILMQAVVFLIAGSHTTNINLSWCLFYTAQNPHIDKKITAEINAVVADRSSVEPFTQEDLPKLVYLNKVWKEALRMCPPAAFLARVAKHDVTLKGSGIKIAKGTQVLPFYQRAQVDSKYWEEPLEFIPERWGTADEPGEGDKVPAGAYVPFSVGPRDCPGRFLAEYEGLLILAELLRRFRFSPGCEAHEIVRASGLVDAGRYSSKKDGSLDMGIPLRVEFRRYTVAMKMDQRAL